MTAMLKLDQVSKAFSKGIFGGERQLAVRDVSLEISAGEVVSLIGESGSGKTTLGKMILRLMPITSGRILFQDEDISKRSGQELKSYYRGVQGVFQDPFSAYNPLFKLGRGFDTVRQNYFPDMDDDIWNSKLDASLKTVGLEAGQIQQKYPHQMSGGQLQRLLIARALLLDIKLLVADEITSMLDASTRIDVLNLLGQFKEQGLGVLFITHDLSLGNYISDRIVILKQGSIVEMGPTENVFGDPRHPYTQMLIDSVPKLHRRWEGLAEHGISAVDEAGMADDQIRDLVEIGNGHFAAV